MGFWMGFTRWIIKTLFVLSIAVFLLVSIGAHFSEKDNLKPLLQEAALSQVSSQQISELKDDLNSDCRGKEYIEQRVEQTNKTIRIDCKNITEEYVKEIFKEQVVGTMFDSIYSQKCDGIQCLLTNPMAVASESANKMLKNFVTISLIITLIFAFLLILITPGISGKLFAIGSPVMLTGLPYFFIGMTKAGILKSMPAQAAAAGEKIVDPILAYISSQFLIMFIMGAVLIIAGFAVKFTLEKKKEIKKMGKKR